MKFAFSLSDPAQKRKALLIPLLVLGLGWSLSQGQEESDPKTPDRAGQPERPTAETPARAPRTKAWTELSLAEITAFNPFPLPAPSQLPDPNEPLTSQPSAATEADVAPPPTQWELQTASIIYRGPKGPLAVIGDATVGIGDLLDKKTRVVDIRDDGVWVSRIADEPQDQSPVQPSLPTSPDLPPDLSEKASKMRKLFGF